MSGKPPKRSPAPPKDDTHPFGIDRHVKQAEPATPTPKPDTRPRTHCKDCFWGQDTSAGWRRCRGAVPGHTSAARVGVGGTWHTKAQAIWAEVADDDYCADAEPL